MKKSKRNVPVRQTSTREHIGELCKFARQGRRTAVYRAFDAAIELAETLHDIGLRNPEWLRPVARHSMYWPSLRAHSKSFTHNFQEIAKKVELSSGVTLALNQTKAWLDRGPTKIVADHVQRVLWMQSLLNQAVDEFEQDGRTDGRQTGLSDYLVTDCLFEKNELAFRTLPPFTQENSEIWWKQAVKPYLEDPRTLDTLRGTPLFDTLSKATANGKDYELRDELKRRCHSAMKKLAARA